MSITEKISKIKEKLSPQWVKENPHVVTVGFIFLLGLFLRLWKIGEVPGGFSGNEKEVVDTILKLDLNHLWLGSKFYQGLYVYGGAIWMAIFGETILNLRIFSALLGSATIVFMYLFISKWFSKKIAIFGCFLFAISSFHISISRLIIPEVILPLILFILFVVLTAAYRNKNIWLFGISGILTGLGFYASPVFLLVPILFLITGAYFVYKNKKFLTAYKDDILIFGVGFLASSLPFWVNFVRNPKSYLTFFGFGRNAWQIIMNVGQIPTLLFSTTPRDFFLNLGTEPLLDPFIFVTFLAGFLFALFSIQKRKNFFMISWLILFSLYAALKRGVVATDLIGILPIIYVISGLLLDYVIDRWFETFPLNKSARLMAMGLISIFFALSALYNYDKYFIAYANSRSVTVEFSEQAPIPLK